MKEAEEGVNVLVPHVIHLGYDSQISYFEYILKENIELYIVLQ